MELIKIYDLNWQFPSDDEGNANVKIEKENMIFKDEGHYIPDVFLNAKDNERGRGYDRMDKYVRSLMDELKPQQVHDFSGIKTIYRYPKLNLSRDKVSLFCADNDVKVIRDPSKADVRILSYGLMTNIIKETWYSEYVTVDMFKKVIHDNTACFDNWLEIVKVIDELEDNCLINTRNGNYYYHPDCIEKYFKPVMDAFHQHQNRIDCRAFIESKNTETFKDIVNGNFKWILDEDANKLMCSDSVTLDDEMYIQLKDMIKSGNREDITVAMTTLANCNIETSKTYIAILFFHYFELFKGTKTYNTVNFKSLRKAFQKYYDNTSYNYGHSARYENLIRLLVEDDALTKSAMEHVLDLVFEEVVLNATGLANSKEVFKIERSSISLTPDMKSKVKSIGFNQAVKEASTLELNDGLPF